MTTTEITERKPRRTYRCAQRRCTIRLAGEDFARLCYAATMRGTPPLVLLEAIVTTTLRANLIDAVLDDR
jgi:hypothetical protein